MTDNLGLNNRVYQILSQNSQKAAVDILGMRISTKYKNKFTEIMITETEAFGTANADEMSLANQLNRKIPLFSVGCHRPRVKHCLVESH